MKQSAGGPKWRTAHSPRRCPEKRRIQIDGRKQLLLSSYGTHLSFGISQFWWDVWRGSLADMAPLNCSVYFTPADSTSQRNTF